MSFLSDLWARLTLSSVNSKLDQIIERDKQIMANIQELRADVDALTTEVAESNKVIADFRATNKEQRDLIANQKAQIDGLNIDLETKNALLAGLDEIDQSIKDQTAALDAGQKETTPEPTDGEPV